MRVLSAFVLIVFLAGCGGGSSSMKYNEITTTLSDPTEFAQDKLWSAALESFSLDQMGVKGKLGLVPRRVPVELEDPEHTGRKLPTEWYTANKESGSITTQWLDIASADVDRFCKCPDDDSRGMVTTSVQLGVITKALEGGSSLDISSVFQQVKGDKTTLCSSTLVLEQELSDLILARAVKNK